MIRLSKVILTSCLSLCMAGCMTSTSGREMNTSQVKAIQKGVTTRAEIERDFGTPISTGMLPDGKRVMMFAYSQSKMKGETFIPFYPGGGADMRRQTLQVIVGPDNVVQDYEFSDTTGETKVGPLGTGGSHTERPTEPATGK